MAKKLITSALPYVNNVPHLGNIIGCVLSADVYARYCRSVGHETLYICATDEYGTATEKKARDEGMSPKEICDKYHELHKNVYEAFDIQFDFFGRTSHPEHIEVTQAIFKDLDAKGYILEQVSEQSYCEHDRLFLADRYVEGICPHCNYDSARGDQCDKCGKLLQPTELKSPKCQICGNAPTTKETKHLYIDLPKLEQELVQFQEDSNKAGDWTANAISATRGWIERGLLPRPITRDLTWGVPVPKEGFEGKVFYVWFDAPIGYISATKRGFPDSWEDWWFNPKQVDLYQFMAKDNIPFHTVVFPASQIGTGKDWTMLHHINSTEYLNYEDDKFSKSRGVGVFGTDVMDLDLDIDLWRFYLLYNRPEKSDSNFSWDGFFEDVNSNFIDNIGNLLNRVLVFYQKNFQGQPLKAEFNAGEREFLAEVALDGQAALAQMERVQIKEALKTILAMGRKGNKFFHDNEPWKLIKENPEAARSLLVSLTYLLRDVAILLFPYMPKTSERVLRLFNQQGLVMSDLGHWESMEGVSPNQPEILFPKLDKKKIEGYKQRFQGGQEDRIDPVEAFAKLEIKVGEIVEIAPHPEAERLYVEKVNLGSEVRTIVSGLVKHYQPEELLGKRVLVATNLKSANLRGVESQGMVLACETKKKLEVIFPEGEIGSRVTLDGLDVEPMVDITINGLDVKSLAEITIDDFFACPLVVKGHLVELEGQSLQIEGKPIRTQKIAEGKIA